MARITSKYIPGNGDLGYSDILFGHDKMRKDHPACEIQGEIENLRNSIEMVLTGDKILQNDLEYLLTWLNRNINSLATFCYLKGDTSRYILPDELISFLNEKTLQLKTKLTDCEDFLRQSHRKLILLDKVRIDARTVERRYTTWRYSNEVVTFQMDKGTELIFAINKHASILNRLSAYIFEATRWEAVLMREIGINVEQRTWMASVEPFELVTHIQSN